MNIVQSNVCKNQCRINHNLNFNIKNNTNSDKSLSSNADFSKASAENYKANYIPNFKGGMKKSPEKKEFKIPTDDEFATLKPQVEAGIAKDPKLKKMLNSICLTKENILVAKYICDNPDLMNSKNFANNVGGIIVRSNSAEIAKAKCDVMDKIKSNPDIMNNQNFADKVGWIIWNSDSAEKAKARCDAMDKIISNPDLMNNKNFADNVGGIIARSDSAESAKAKCDVMDYIKSNPDLMNNKNFADKVGDIIVSSYSAEAAKARCDVMDKIISIPELMNNKSFADKVGRIIWDSYSAESAKAKCDVMDSIKSNPDLMKNKNFADKVGKIIADTDSAESAKAKCDVMDKIKSNPDLMNNKNFADNVGLIIALSNSAEKAKARCDVMTEISSKPKILEDKTFSDNLGNMLSAKRNNLTLNNMKDYAKALEIAFERKNQLRSADNEISNDIISKRFNYNINKIMDTIEILGLPTFTHNYTSKLDGVVELSDKVASLKYNLSDTDFNSLMAKINPENSTQYKELTKEITELKKTFPQVKASGDKNKLIELQNQIATLTKQSRELLNSKINLDPQTVTDKIRVLSAIAEHNSDDAAKFIDLIKDKTPENEKIWKEEANKYIFKTLDLEFDSQVSERLSLGQSKYVGEILSGDSDFKDGFKEIVTLLKQNPDKSIKDIFDALPQNQQTRKMFNEIGIDYDKWVQVDKNSFTSVKIETSVEASKKSAIVSLENDFNDSAFLSLPKEETAKIFNSLKNIGVEVKECEESHFDANGIQIGTNKVLRLYKNNKPIEFEELPKIISTVKKSLNENDFWTTKMNNSSLDSYRETMYSHLTKDRDAQIKNTAALKDDKVVNLEIRKTDMNNIQHALFLGNHGSCCTAVGTGFKQFSAPTYIKNKMISAIEVVDGDNFIGNTMCYIAKVDGKPSLILDNIELKSEYHNNDKLRDAMFVYAKKMCEEIGQPDLPIYAGSHRQKLDMGICDKSEHTMQIVGTTAGDRIYLDFLTDGREVSGNEVDTVMLYKIR